MIMSLVCRYMAKEKSRSTESGSENPVEAHFAR